MLERKTNENKLESKMIEEERQKWFLKKRTRNWNWNW